LEVKSLKHNASSINYLPTVTINNSLKQTDYINYHGTSYDDGVNNQISLQVSMPIFDAGKISKDKESSQLEVLALNKEIEHDEKRVKIEKDLAFLSLESAKAKLNSAISALEATNTAYDYSKKRFESNLISYTEYLQELTKKQEANSRVITARNEIEIKKAELAFALGTNLITLIKD
jgi:outer membrane protein TolC